MVNRSRRSTVERLMKANGWRGVTRRKEVRTTIADPAAGRVPDLVDRKFGVAAPNVLLVADFTYVRLTGGVFVDTAFAIDAYAGRIVGWTCSAGKSDVFVRSGTPPNSGGSAHCTDWLMSNYSPPTGCNGTRSTGSCTALAASHQSNTRPSTTLQPNPRLRTSKQVCIKVGAIQYYQVRHFVTRLIGARCRWARRVCSQRGTAPSLVDS